MSNDSNIKKGLSSFFAGAFSGVCEVATSQPFDIVKVRLQNAGGSALKVLTNLIINEGPLSLWKGSGVCLLGSCFSNSITFGAVENCKRYLKNRKEQPLTLFDYAICGFFSGSVTSLISTPIEGVTIKIQTQGYLDYRGDPHYNNTFRYGLHLLRSNGIFGLYRGFFTTYLRDSIGTTFYFVTYQALPKYLLEKSDINQEKDFFSIIISGGFAGIAF